MPAKLWPALLVFLITRQLSAQPFPKGYFIKPIDTAFYLSGTFGSLREGHFHSGMDIRTYEREGFPVKAAAEGYVVRIKVSPFGYGKAIYINHPNGFTTQYGHLSAFEDSIDAYVKRKQYQRESFDIDLFLKPGEMPVRQGEIIGFSGNSGGSSGPHLHFEIRHTFSEDIIDPMYFDLGFADTLPPKINSVFFFNLDRQAKKTLGYNQPAKPVNYSGVIRKGDTVQLGYGVYGMGATMEDLMLIRDWGFGCNHFSMSLNGRVVYQCDIGRFHFDNTKYLNTHLDYYALRRTGIRLHKLFVDYGNKMNFYSYVQNRGFIFLTDSSLKRVTIKAYDLQGKVDSFYCYVKGVSVSPVNKDGSGNPELLKKTTEKEISTRLVAPDKKENVIFPMVRLNIPAGALYDSLYISYTVKKNKRYGSVVGISNIYIPIHSSVELSVKVDKNPPGLPKQWCLARVYNDGSRSYCGGTYKNGWMTARVKMFGDFAVTSDITDPVIKPLTSNLKNKPAKDSVISFYISDDFSGIDSYRCLVDGKWLLMDYDAKNDRLTGVLPPDLSPGKHELALIVSDNCGNRTKFTAQISIP